MTNWKHYLWKSRQKKILRQASDTIANLKSECNDFPTDFEELRQRHSKFKGKAAEIETSVSRMDTGKTNLDEILSMGKTHGNHYGIGYQVKASSINAIPSNRKFVKEGMLQDNEPKRTNSISSKKKEKTDAKTT